MSDAITEHSMYHQAALVMTGGGSGEGCWFVGVSEWWWWVVVVVVVVVGGGIGGRCL